MAQHDELVTLLRQIELFQGVDRAQIPVGGGRA